MLKTLLITEIYLNDDILIGKFLYEYFQQKNIFFSKLKKLKIEFI